MENVGSGCLSMPSIKPAHTVPTLVRAPFVPPQAAKPVCILSHVMLMLAVHAKYLGYLVQTQVEIKLNITRASVLTSPVMNELHCQGQQRYYERCPPLGESSLDFDS